MDYRQAEFMKVKIAYPCEDCELNGISNSCLRCGGEGYIEEWEYLDVLLDMLNIQYTLPRPMIDH